MAQNSWFRERSRPTRLFVTLVVTLVVFTVLGSLIIGDSTGAVADAAWLLQMILLLGCVGAAAAALVGGIRRRSAQGTGPQ